MNKKNLALLLSGVMCIQSIIPAYIPVFANISVHSEVSTDDVSGRIGGYFQGDSTIHLAICSNGDLYRWGDGYGFPKKVSEIGKAKFVGFGYKTGIVVDELGQVWTIGSGKNGTLGVGNSNDNYDNFQKVVDEDGVPLTGVKKAIISDFCGIALLENGSCYAWGKTNGFETDGENLFETINYARKIEIDPKNTLYDDKDLTLEELKLQTTDDVLDESREIVDISITKKNTFFVLNDGSVLVLGSTDSGLASVSTDIDRFWNDSTGAASSLMTRPQFMRNELGEKITGVKKIYSCDSTTLALMENGDVYCTGMLGVYAKLPRSLFLKQIPQYSGVTSMSLYGSNVLSTHNDGKSYVWGKLGALDGNESFNETVVAGLTEITGAKDFVAITHTSTSNGLGAMAVDKNGQIFAWGNNKNRQTGTVVYNTSLYAPVGKVIVGVNSEKDVFNVPDGPIYFDELISLYEMEIDEPFHVHPSVEKNYTLVKPTSSDIVSIDLDQQTIEPLKSGTIDLELSLEVSSRRISYYKDSLRFKNYPTELNLYNKTTNEIINDSILLKEPLQIDVQVEPLTENFTYNLFVEDETILKISEDGILTPLSSGETNLVCTVEEQTFDGETLEKRIPIIVKGQSLDISADKGSILAGDYLILEVNESLAAKSSSPIEIIATEPDVNIEMISENTYKISASEKGEKHLTIKKDELVESFVFETQLEAISCDHYHLIVDDLASITLPTSLPVQMHDASVLNIDVEWGELEKQEDGHYQASGSFLNEPYIINTLTPTINVEVTESHKDILSIHPFEKLSILANEEPILPEVANVALEDNSVIELPVKWDLSNFSNIEIGEHTINGEIVLSDKIINTSNEVALLKVDVLPVVIKPESIQKQHISSKDDIIFPSEIKCEVPFIEDQLYNVTWESIESINGPGEYQIKGELDVPLWAEKCFVYLDILWTDDSISIVNIEPLEVMSCYATEKIVLPDSTNATLSNGDDIKVEITWDNSIFETTDIGQQLLTGEINIPSQYEYNGTTTISLSLNVLKLEPNSPVLNTLLVKQNEVINLENEIDIIDNLGNHHLLSVNWEPFDTTSVGTFKIAGEVIVPEYMNDLTIYQSIEVSSNDKIEQIRTIKEINPLPQIETFVNQPVTLPGSINCLLDTNEEINIAVKWDEPINYTTPAALTIQGEFILPERIENPLHLTPYINLLIKEQPIESEPTPGPVEKPESNNTYSTPSYAEYSNVTIYYMNIETGDIINTDKIKKRVGSKFEAPVRQFNYFEYVESSPKNIKVNKNPIKNKINVYYRPTSKQTLFKTNIQTPYLKGFPGGLFKPQNPLTRAELCAILSRLLTDEASNYEDNALDQTIFYKDVPYDFWAYKDIAKLSKMGLFTGYPNGSFLPNQYITIAEFATVIANPSNHLNHVDHSTFWASQALYDCLERSIITPEMFNNPHRAITRAEAVYAINKLIEKESSLQNYTSKFIDVTPSTPYWKDILVSSY